MSASDDEYGLKPMDISDDHCDLDEYNSIDISSNSFDTVNVSESTNVNNSNTNPLLQEHINVINEFTDALKVVKEYNENNNVNTHNVVTNITPDISARKWVYARRTRNTSNQNANSSNTNANSNQNTFQNNNPNNVMFNPLNI